MAFFSHAFDAVLRKRMGVISYGYFLLLAAVVFSPFLIKGAILVGSSDFIDFIYPILMNARRDFLDAKWSFWNPYVLSGVATGNLAFSPQYLPENWILFLLPERLFFAGLTFWSFVKFSGVGFVAFLIFYREVQSRAWALVAATTYMLSGFVLWSLLVDNLSLVFYFTLSLFILWSLKERSLSRSFLSLVFCLYSLLMSSNILYVFYALIALLLLGGYQLKRTLAPRLTGWMTVSSLVTALLLSAVRWIPAIVELAASNRTNGSMESEFSGGGILALRLIIPEIFGVAFPTSIQVLQELSPVFKDGHVNIFAHFPHYFALLPLSLVLFALVSCVRKKIPLFFIVLLLISFALSTRSEPIHTPVRLFLHPIYHGLSMQLFSGWPFVSFLRMQGRGWRKV